MRIGFIKLGLKTYFKKDGTGQGSNHELVDVFNIFKERGHECFMLSNSDIPQYDKSISDLQLDWIFVFNGFVPVKWETTMNMFKGSLESLKYLKEHKDIPYAYFWTDPRYDISKNPIFKEIPPVVILSQEQKDYTHLDKLVMYNKTYPVHFKKDIFFSILMNDTGEIIRRKSMFDVVTWLKDARYEYEVVGEWKGIFKEKQLKEDEVMPYLSRVSYSYNCGKNKDWVSQKFWEMAMNNVICFYSNYDSQNLIMKEDDFRRVVDGIDVVEKIKKLERMPDLIIRDTILPEYLDGSFVYKKIMEKLNVHST